MDKHILDTINRSAKLILYPSSCGYRSEFQDIPYDAIILNSNAFKKNILRGKVYCLNYDNNELLGLLFSKGISISAIVIIRDGCVEGGNYECIAKDGFFGRLMPVMSEKFDYFCDHQSFSKNVPAQFDEFASPAYLEPLIKFSAPLNPVKSYHVKIKTQIEKDFILGRTRVKIIRDSVWRNYDPLNLTVVKKIGSSKAAVSNYLAGLLPENDLYKGFEFAFHSGNPSIKRFMQKADKMELDRLSLIPIANGRYKTIACEIELWEGEYPREICFYHLNENDFEYLKSLND